MELVRCCYKFAFLSAVIAWLSVLALIRYPLPVACQTEPGLGVCPCKDGRRRSHPADGWQGLCEAQGWSAGLPDGRTRRGFSRAVRR